MILIFQCSDEHFRTFLHLYLPLNDLFAYLFLSRIFVLLLALAICTVSYLFCGECAVDGDADTPALYFNATREGFNGPEESAGQETAVQERQEERHT